MDTNNIDNFIIPWRMKNPHLRLLVISVLTNIKAICDDNVGFNLIKIFKRYLFSQFLASYLVGNDISVRIPILINLKLPYLQLH